MKIKRILLSGGGTGGHIYPALSIYNRMKELNPALECLYVGTETGLEAQIVPKQNIPFATIKISGLKRSLSLDNLKVVWQMLSSTQKAKKIIKEFNPDVVIGTGGFVCAPVLYAAAKLGIPTMIHEQNSVAGVTNKFLSNFVDQVAISFEEVRKDFDKVSEKVVFTGNPRGQEVLSSPKDELILEEYGFDSARKTVLIFGGSRGAPAINKAAINSIELFKMADYQVIIGTGSVHFQDWQEYIQAHKINVPENVRIVPYIDNMPALFQMIDLAVCRSGATTLAELTALGLPSILVPSPYVTGNHQYYNAMALVNNNAAEILSEDEINSESLSQKINQIFNQANKLEEMAQNAKKLGTPDAINQIITHLEAITQ